MPPAQHPLHEAQRLEAVERLQELRGAQGSAEQVLATLREQLGVPYAFINIVGRATQYPFLSNPCGPDSSDRQSAFCSHVVFDNAALVVPDAAADPRFADNPMVLSGQIGFYYGWPVYTPEGLVAGALCVHGPEPRVPRENEIRLLGRLAGLVTEELRQARRFHDMEARSRSREQQLALLVAHAPAAIAMLDREMRYLAVSDRWLTDYRVEHKSVIGMRHADLFPRTSETRWEQYRRCLAGESLSGERDRFEHADGSVDFVRWRLVPWHDNAGGVGGLVMFTEVITAEVEALARVEESNQRLSLALRSAQAGLWDWSVETGRVFVDEGWWPVHGYEHGAFEPVVENLWALVHPDDRAAQQQATVAIIEGRSDTFKTQYRMRRGDGSYFWVEGHGYAAERDRSGRATRLVGLNLDIDARKHLELQTLRHNEDLREAKRMLEDQASRLVDANRQAREARERAESANHAKTRFLANMSHEIRTPLTAILGYAEILEDAGPGAPPPPGCVRTIRENGGHLLALINDVLDLSKIEAGGVRIEPEGCDPREVVAEAVTLVTPLAAAKSLDLNAEIDAATPERVLTDPMRLRQVLVNLLGNAVKFTPGGSVTVRVAPDAGNRLRFEVADTGIGMTPEQAARVFEPFVQADSSTTRRHGGTGLGLTISSRLATLLGGALTIAETRPNAGTTIRLTIDRGPAASEAAEPAPARVLPPGPAPDSVEGAHVLLAEDGPDNQHLLTYLLRRAGATVTVVSDGVQAIEAARAADAPFHLILMDMQMPEMDGYQATSHLRALGITLPVIALTANAMDGDRLRCLQAGCDDYASKPITGPELVKVCSRWLRRRASENPAAA